MDSNGQDPFAITITQAPQADAPTQPGLAQLLKLQKLQLIGMEELQRVLEEDIYATLRTLEQRPILDVEAITKRQDETIDVIDRMTTSRVKKLVQRRWWSCWLWGGFGLMTGMLLAYWTLETPRGKQLFSVVWPQTLTQQSGKKK